MVVVTFQAHEWQCRTCGSTRARRAPAGKLKGCADCHRRREARRPPRERPDDDDIVITPAIRAYLDAFTRYLMAGKTGDTALVRETESEKAAAFRRLEHARRENQQRA